VERLQSTFVGGIKHLPVRFGATRGSVGRACLRAKVSGSVR